MCSGDRVQLVWPLEARMSSGLLQRAPGPYSYERLMWCPHRKEIVLDRICPTPSLPGAHNMNHALQRFLIKLLLPTHWKLQVRSAQVTKRPRTALNRCQIVRLQLNNSRMRPVLRVEPPNFAIACARTPTPVRRRSNLSQSFSFFREDFEQRRRNLRGHTRLSFRVLSYWP